MSDKHAVSSHAHPANEVRSRTRRKFLLLIPSAALAAIGATLASAAFRFLHPHTSQAGAGDAGTWTPLAPLSELTGAQPSPRKIFIEHDEGWIMTREERVVYVLGGEDRQVVSGVCPHEGCEVSWRNEARDFFCPCHDSRFDAAGVRLSGPAARDLERLPTRVENGILQVQYREPTGDSKQTSVGG